MLITKRSIRKAFSAVIHIYFLSLMRSDHAKGSLIFHARVATVMHKVPLRFLNSPFIRLSAPYGDIVLSNVSYCSAGDIIKGSKSSVFPGEHSSKHLKTQRPFNPCTINFSNLRFVVQLNNSLWITAFRPSARILITQVSPKTGVPHKTSKAK